MEFHLLLIISHYVIGSTTLHCPLDKCQWSSESSKRCSVRSTISPLRRSIDIAQCLHKSSMGIFFLTLFVGFLINIQYICSQSVFEQSQKREKQPQKARQRRRRHKKSLTSTQLGLPRLRSWLGSVGYLAIVCV